MVGTMKAMHGWARETRTVSVRLALSLDFGLSFPSPVHPFPLSPFHAPLSS